MECLTGKFQETLAAQADGAKRPLARARLGRVLQLLRGAGSDVALGHGLPGYNLESVWGEDWIWVEEGRRW